MSLMRRIGRGLLRAPKPAPVPTSARTVSRAETRARISAGLKRRNAPVRAELAPVSPPTPSEGVEVFGEPLPPPPVVSTPLEPAVVAAASVAAEKAAAAAKVEAQRAAVELTARWQSPCKAIDASTGLQCGLMKGHAVEHRHARGIFLLVAQGPVTRAVDAAAWRDSIN